MSFSLYDIRKAARTAQNTVFSSPQDSELLIIRQATTTDAWGPSTKQLQEVRVLGRTMGVRYVLELIFRRVSEYLGVKSVADRYNVMNRPRSSSAGFKLYSKAVHYVNSGYEWRIVLKCLKLVDDLVVHSDGHESITEALGSHKDTLEVIVEKYHVSDTHEAGEMGAITSVRMEQLEHNKVVMLQAQRVLKLLEDEAFRNKEQSIAMKLSNSIDSEGNHIRMRKTDELSAGMQNYKSKDMDPSKVQNSNVKSEFRNQLGHIVHRKRALPGVYQEFDEFGAVQGDSLFDDNQLLEYDDEDDGEDKEEQDSYQYFEASGKSSKFRDTTPPEKQDTFNKAEYKDEEDVKEEQNDDDDDEEFGGFQASPMTNKASEQLISFEGDDSSPQNQTLDSLMDVKGTPTTSPTTTTKSSDVFADLFSNAKH